MKNSIVLATIVAVSFRILAFADDFPDITKEPIRKAGQRAGSETKIGPLLQRLLDTEPKAASDTGLLVGGWGRASGNKIRIHLYVRDTDERLLNRLVDLGGEI